MTSNLTTDDIMASNLSTITATVDLPQNTSRCGRQTVDNDLDFEWATEGILILIVGVVGFVGNCTSVVTFSRQKVHRIFHNLLLFLALFDVVS